MLKSRVCIERMVGPALLAAALLLGAPSTAAPGIDVQPSGVAEQLVTGDTGVRELFVRNIGDQDLDWSVEEAGVSCGPEDDQPWLGVNPTSATMAPNTLMTVQVTFDSTGLVPPQNLRACLRFVSNAPGAPPVVSAELRVVVPQVPALAPWAGLLLLASLAAALPFMLRRRRA